MDLLALLAGRMNDRALAEREQEWFSWNEAIHEQMASVGVRRVTEDGWAKSDQSSATESSGARTWTQGGWTQIPLMRSGLRESSKDTVILFSEDTSFKDDECSFSMAWQMLSPSPVPTE